MLTLLILGLVLALLFSGIQKVLEHPALTLLLVCVAVVFLIASNHQVFAWIRGLQ